MTAVVEETDFTVVTFEQVLGEGGNLMEVLSRDPYSLEASRSVEFGESLCFGMSSLFAF